MSLPSGDIGEFLADQGHPEEGAVCVQRQVALDSVPRIIVVSISFPKPINLELDVCGNSCRDGFFVQLKTQPSFLRCSVEILLDARPVATRDDPFDARLLNDKVKKQAQVCGTLVERVDDQVGALQDWIVQNARENLGQGHPGICVLEDLFPRRIVLLPYV